MDNLVTYTVDNSDICTTMSNVKVVDGKMD